MPKAMILAAGTGTRLQPLTDHTPKALLHYNGKPMLAHIIQKLKMSGIDEILINVHHLGEQIMEYVYENEKFGIDIQFSDERGMLMDTGGGIYKAREYFFGHGSFIVHNIDILSDIDLMEMYNDHVRNDRLATLAVKQRTTSRNFLTNKAQLLCGWKNNQTGEEIITREDKCLIGTAFSGIHILSEGIFIHLEREGPFSITDAYLEISKNHPVYLYDHSQSSWIDMAHPTNFPGLLK